MNMAVEESAASVGERCNSRSILDDQSVREVVRSRSWQGTLGRSRIRSSDGPSILTLLGPVELAARVPLLQVFLALARLS